MKLHNKPAERFDWTLAFILLLFCIVSLFAIASAQTTGQYGENFVPSQIQWYVSWINHYCHDNVLGA